MCVSAEDACGWHQLQTEPVAQPQLLQGSTRRPPRQAGTRDSDPPPRTRGRPPRQAGTQDSDPLPRTQGRPPRQAGTQDSDPPPRTWGRPPRRAGTQDSDPPARTRGPTRATPLCQPGSHQPGIRQGSKGSAHGHHPLLLCLESILLHIDSSFEFSHQGFTLNLKSVDKVFGLELRMCVCVCVNPKLLIYHFPNISPLATLS